ncbi:hypothetical protein PS467_18895 [Streptomyces luomodiensis]|uniref:Aromatic ring-opening dioxygenase LigA n=1 Tax=Streptomyces luomodiensis TaxID=3026192 RepID=A0ABY9UXG1_9ACTN|nr:hypothetical protein [Streptomyces sp. SCA4-21]WNE97249.1 hypothetical protein PS467_18895 [Streptomyces sp. SCA4-21]
MGIESEKLVYDYLSRVGDLAQQQGLSSGERMRLVSGLRADIDHRRATGGSDSPAGVKRILSKLGSPADVVAAAGGRPPDPGAGSGADPGAETGGTAGGAPPRGAAGAARAARDKLAGLAKSSGLTGKVPAPREENAPGATGVGQNGGPSGSQNGDGAPSLIKPRPATPAGPSPNAASPPHLAGEDELSPRESNMDWWHVEPGPFAQPERRDAQYGSVEGFTGGIEIPELLGGGKTAERQREERREAEEKAAEAAAEAQAAAGAQAEAQAKGKAGGKPRGPLRRVLLGPGKAAGRPEGGGGVTWLTGLGPVLLVAVGLLVAGAALGNIVLIGFGWVIAYYGTYRRSPAAAKWAALGLPGLVVAGGVLWLWGRSVGKWGEPIPEHGMKDAVIETWPFIVRGAAAASVLFLLWRSRRKG